MALPVTMVAGQVKTLQAQIEDADGNPMGGLAATWATSDATVATVDANGTVTAVSSGTATITATSGNLTSTAAVTVGARTPTALVLTVKK